MSDEKVWTVALEIYFPSRIEPIILKNSLTKAIEDRNGIVSISTQQLNDRALRDIDLVAYGESEEAAKNNAITKTKNALAVALESCIHIEEVNITCVGLFEGGTLTETQHDAQIILFDLSRRRKER